MTLVFRHEQPDRVPFWDSPWNGTISRWKKEGMPENFTGENYFDYFGLDKIARIQPDNSPRFDEILLEKMKRTKSIPQNGAPLRKS